MLIKREAVPAPALERETVEVPELGGEVIVQGITGAELFRLSAEVRERQEVYYSALLSRTVLADDDLPLWTQGEWEVWIGQHLDAAGRLVKVAQRIVGHDNGPEEKKGESSPS